MRPPLQIISLFLLLLTLHSCSPLGDAVDASLSNSYYHQPLTGFIIYSPDGNWFERAYEKLDADQHSFIALSNYAGKDAHMVFYEHYPQPQVDVATFTVSDNVMKDRNSVYTVVDNRELTPIIGADPNTFIYLAPSSTNTLVWAKDRSGYYFNDVKVKVDHATFKLVNEHIFSDKDSIYIESGHGIVGIDASTEPLDSINRYYARGKTSIYYYGYMNFNKGYAKTTFSEIRKMKLLDEVTLNVNDTILYEGYIHPVATVDGATFGPVAANTFYYKDRNHVYHLDKVIPEADANTFEVIRLENDDHPKYAKDKHHVYWMGKVVEHAHPAKFHFDKAKQQWTDGTRIFQ